MLRHGPKCLEGPVFLSIPKWAQHDPSAVPATSLNEAVARQTGIRWELVQRVRREIAGGTYETPEKWEAALDAMLRSVESM